MDVPIGIPLYPNGSSPLINSNFISNVRFYHQNFWQFNMCFSREQTIRHPTFSMPGSCQAEIPCQAGIPCGFRCFSRWVSRRISRRFFRGSCAFGMAFQPLGFETQRVGFRSVEVMAGDIAWYSWVVYVWWKIPCINGWWLGVPPMT